MALLALSRITQVSWYQNQLEFYWSNRQWVAVASSGPYANLHITQTDNHASTPPLSFLQAACPSYCPINSIKALILWYITAFPRSLHILMLILGPGRWKVLCGQRKITFHIVCLQWWVSGRTVEFVAIVRAVMMHSQFHHVWWVPSDSVCSIRRIIWWLSTVCIV